MIPSKGREFREVTGNRCHCATWKHCIFGRSALVAKLSKDRSAWSMANLSQASIASAFLRSAAQFSVAESDFLVLSSLGISTYEAFALRVPAKEDLESFLQDTLCPRAAYRDETLGLVTFARHPPVTWQAFKMTDDAAAIRKLWLLAKEVCKAELERMASGEGENKVKVRLSGAVAMEAAAIQRGMPRCRMPTGHPCTA